MKNDTEKIHAWLIPDNALYPMIPLGSKSKVFGYNRRKCDIALDSICADGRQAELDWDGENVYIASLSTNGLTRLNDEIIGESKEPVYHNEYVTMGVERFRLYRCDSLRRPILKYSVCFNCDGEAISKQEYMKGEGLTLPEMPLMREEDSGIKTFVKWIGSDGETVTQGSKCVKSESYSAIYRDLDPHKDMAATISGKEEIYLTNVSTYSISRVPVNGLKIGGSKTCDFCFTSLIGICAEVEWGNGKLTVQADNIIKVNGKAVPAGESVIIYDKDSLEIADRKYFVIGHKKAERPPEKQPILLRDNGDKIVLSGLNEGNAVALGRDHQDMFSNIWFVGRTHAFIRKKEGKYYITDNNSKNGSSVKKAGSTEEIQLSADSEVQIDAGDTIKLFVYEFTFALE